MPSNPEARQVSEPERSALLWLLDSDPSIRWQVMRDLIGAPVDQVATERARVATEGAGARLLALQGAEGEWGGAAWNRGWNSTMHVSCCCGTWVSIRRVTRRAGRRASSVIERDRKDGTAWSSFAFPTWWHYDVLRGLDYLRSAGVTVPRRDAGADR